MSLTIAVTGQILLHGPLDLTGPGTDRLHSMLAADATIANLEATVETAVGWPMKTKTLHLATPEALGSIRDLGFHAVTHANNHAFDLGPPGILATADVAANAGLLLTGSGRDLKQASEPAIITPSAGPAIALFAVDLGPQPDIVYAAADRAGIAPLRMRRQVALPRRELQTLRGIAGALGDDKRLAARQSVGYSAHADGLADGFEAFGTAFVPGETVAARWRVDETDLDRLATAIAAARWAGRFVVLSLHSHHWDPDWTRTPDWMLDLADRLMAVGVDLILATGSPLLQPVSFVRGRPVLGGLGNFVFHTHRPETYAATGLDVWRSAVLRLRFGSDGAFHALEALPIAVGRPAVAGAMPAAPTPLDGNDAAEVMDRLTQGLSPDEQRLITLAAD